jgi:hypothetical protein
MSLDEFRSLIKNSCQEDLNSGNGSVVIASYARRILNQTGTGHFSPIGGYHEAKDLVLILDVARFKVVAFIVLSYLLSDSTLLTGFLSLFSMKQCC